MAPRFFPLLLVGLAACTVPDLGAVGRPCSSEEPCGPATSCDPVSHTCVASGLTEGGAADGPGKDQQDTDGALRDGAVGDSRRDSGKRDGKPLDAKPLDHKLADQKKPLDLKPPDLKPHADLYVYKPLTTSALSSALAVPKVACVDKNGVTQPGTIPIIDTATVTFVNGSVSLAGAPQDTKTWVGAKSSVTVIFDPNACDAIEDPIMNDSDWSSAGMLVRGATLDYQGRLVLAPGTTASDIDIIDVSPGGAFEGTSDFGKPDDSTISAHPQLVLPLSTAKATLIQAATY